MAPKRKWTEQDDAELLLLWPLGCSLKVLAKALGRTMGATVQRALLLPLGVRREEQARASLRELAKHREGRNV